MLNVNLFQWLTGVVAVSGVIVGHKWLYLDQKRLCPIPFIKRDVLQEILSETLVTKHTVLAVNSKQNGKIKAIVSTKEAQVYTCTVLFSQLRHIY